MALGTETVLHACVYVYARLGYTCTYIYNNYIFFHCMECEELVPLTGKRGLC